MAISDFTDLKQPVFSCLDFYEQEQSEELTEKKERFKKRSNRKKTAIFEMIGTMICILDPSKDNFSMQD